MQQELWNFAVSMYSSHPFLTGIVLGVFTCAAVILIFLVVTRLFGASKVSVFSYSGPSGRITIRSSAVVSLIFSLEKDFPEFVIVKAGLYRKGGSVSLRVMVDYRQGGRPFPAAVSLFQQTVLDKLKGGFGIEDVRQVEVCMRGSSAEDPRSRL